MLAITLKGKHTRIGVKTFFCLRWTGYNQGKRKGKVVPVLN
jgi:hypothetical protein